MATQIQEGNKGGFGLPWPNSTPRAPAQSSPDPWPGGPVETAYVVLQVTIAAGLGQQQLDDLHMPMLTGTHEGRGALVILDVDVSPTGQQALHHVYPSVTDRQHEGRLSRLWEEITGTSEVHTELAVVAPSGAVLGKGGKQCGDRRERTGHGTTWGGWWQARRNQLPMSYELRKGIK